LVGLFANEGVFMDKVKHEIEAALIWLEEGNIERAKLHLGFALQWRNDEANQQKRAPDVCHKSPSKTHSWYGSSQGYVCEHCGTRR
jgi:hypothetical protein